MPTQPDPATAGPCGAWVDALPCAGEGEEALAARAIAVATEVVWALSGRRFGPSCPMTVRPCERSYCGAWRGAWLLGPMYAADVAPRQPQVLACDRITHLLDLGTLGPIYAVDAVTVAGVAFGESEWQIEERRYLRRLDGLPWPQRQDLDAPLTEPDTFGVTWRVGVDPGAGGTLAVEALGCEVLKGLRPEGRCRLPRRARTVARQGTTVDLDVSAFLTDGRTGLDEVDLWLATVNPEGLTSASTVTNPDTYRRHRVNP